MLNQLIALSLRQRAVVMLLTGVAVAGGLWAMIRLPIDAMPDITHVQVQINTAVPGLAPEEIEQQVTFPLENKLSGLPAVVEFRSLSKVSLSQVTLVFADGTDIYRARQLVSERLQNAAEDLPPDLSPRLSPVATGLGEIFYYTLDYTAEAQNKPPTRREQLMELRLVHESIVKPLLRQTPGLAEINTSGGYEKQYVVQPDAEKLRDAGMTLADLVAHLEENTRNAGGGFVEIGGEQIIIRVDSRAATPGALAAIPLKFAGGVKPLLLSDVATVQIGSNSRTGAATVDGQEALVCAAIMLADENTRLVSSAVAENLRVIEAKLPSGLQLRPLYNRSHLVNRTIHTVATNLVEGAALVIVILFALLGNWRAAAIVTLVIPLSMLCATVGMLRLGIPGNLMSLGAIDFGLIIDGAVVMVENIVRHLGHKQQELGRRLSAAERTREVLKSAQEVANPMFFGVLIITVVYVPILALQGIEGKMFQPMAVVVMLALGAALVLALTLMPVLCSFLLGGRIQERDNWLVTLTKRLYAPLLAFGLRFRWLVILPMVALFAWSLVLLSRMGSELLPKLDEGDFTTFMVRSASAGLDVSIDLQCRAERLLLERFPEIEHTFARIGTDEIASDPMGVNVSDAYLMLKPRSDWRIVDGEPIEKEKLADLMRAELLQRIPGQTYLFSQPIQMRFNEILEGTRADVAVKIFGGGYDKLTELAGAALEILEDVPGGGDVEPDAIGKTPALVITPKPDALHRFALDAEDINNVVETALAGHEVGRFIEGNRRLPIVVRMPETVRADLDAIGRLPVGTDGGGLLTLSQVADIRPVFQISTVVRENAQRRVAILINVRGRDIAGYVGEAQAKLREGLKLPQGYYLDFGGQFKNLQEAKARLTIVVPLALALIFVLIYLSFRSFKQAALIFLCVPLAVTGGIFALHLRGMPFTISAAVGFIALSGIAVLNGIMLISFINQLRDQGRNLRDAVVEGTLTRLRPKLMTALVASLGFLPMALATSAGAEVQRPIATVVIGGIVSSTFLTLLVVPLLYEWLERKTKPQTQASPSP